MGPKNKRSRGPKQSESPTICPKKDRNLKKMCNRESRAAAFGGPMTAGSLARTGNVGSTNPNSSRLRKVFWGPTYVRTRSRYSPVRVSTLIISPISINAGQMTSAPVSSFTGLVSLVAVSPRTAGSQYSTLSTI
jgi:hypothetical protein